MKPLGVIALVLALAAAAPGLAAGPFGVAVSLSSAGTNGLELTAAFSVPRGHYLYAERTAAQAEGAASLRPIRIPKPYPKHDSFDDAVLGVYTQDVSLSYGVDALAGDSFVVRVSHQGCSESMCFAPVSSRYRVRVDGTVQALGDEPDPPSPAPGPADAVPDFRVAGSAAGYLAPAAFLEFLDRAASGAESGAGGVQAGVARGRSPWAWLGWGLLVVLWGLGLNLTPCVLPMIPVNLAIIGAGSMAASRWRGFRLGCMYGLGMALAYGGLGLAAVQTGAKLGTLNSSPWLYLGVGAVFLVMGLGLFGVVPIDFSRFLSGLGARAGRSGGYLAALVLGAVAAVLAGACVAPVVLSVIALAIDLCARGYGVGRLLPFLLGLGMALPWPFAGAGLSFLPPPGRWMEWLKRVFGLVILVAAVVYIVLGARQLADRAGGSRAAVAEAQRREVEEGGWLTSPDAALRQAAAEGKPVFIDFWATWCGSCLKMDRTTFRDPAVVERLGGYVKVKYQAEQPAAPETRAVLDRFGVLGFPTYVVVVPVPAGAP